MSKPFDIALFLSGVLTGSTPPSNDTYGKSELCSRLSNSDGSEIIPGPGSSNMCAGFSPST